jgi:hypothetical protein
LRIALDQDSGVQVVRLDGWLEGEAVAELERVMSGCAGALRLDLTHLRSADPAGLIGKRDPVEPKSSRIGAPTPRED